MPITQATTNVVNLDKDTLINGMRVGLGAGNIGTNTCVGSLNMTNNTTGFRNTAVGHACFEFNTIGTYNTAVGTTALRMNTIGNANSSIGHAALAENTTGSGNTAVGASSLGSNTTGSFNTALGNSALISNTVANSNTAVGSSALQANTIGASNTAVGGNSLASNQTGMENTAIGVSALQACRGGGNVSVGYRAAYSMVTGFDNTAIGVNSLYMPTGGDFNTACGANALGSNGSWSNTGGFGNNANVANNNQIRIGDSFVTSVTCQTNAWSDERDKADIRDTILGLNFIEKLRPVDFKWDFREDYRPKIPAHVDQPIEPKEDASEEEKAEYAEKLAAYNTFRVELDKWREDVKWANIVHDGTHKRTRYHHGLIAQEVKSVIEQTGIDFGGFQDNAFNGGDEVMTIGYTELIGPLIKAVQELSAKVAELEAK